MRERNYFHLQFLCAECRFYAKNPVDSVHPVKKKHPLSGPSKEAVLVRISREKSSLYIRIHSHNTGDQK